MTIEKEQYRLYWIIKGRLMPKQWDKTTKKDCYNDYFKRCWYNEESYLWEDGFEEAYEEYNKC